MNSDVRSLDPHADSTFDDGEGSTVITTISREELFLSLRNGDPIVLVEALGAGYFADAHLPGALNMPPDQVDVLAPRLIPEHSTSVVVYCSGTCQNSEIAAARLQDLGYHDVRVYLGGKEDWVEHGLPIERTSGDID